MAPAHQAPLVGEIARSLPDAEGVLTTFAGQLIEAADAQGALDALIEAVQTFLPTTGLAILPAPVLVGSANPLTLNALLTPDSDLAQSLVANPYSTHELPEGIGTGYEYFSPLVAVGECFGLVLLEELPEIDARPLLTAMTAWTAATIAALQARHQADAANRILTARADELGIAEIIQRSLLPQGAPRLPDWSITQHYQPARTIGGDLYDFIPLPNGLLALVLGDASDKGVPAALMMATVKPLLRAAAQRLVLPGLVLAEVNEGLCTQIPPGMFVTCFLALLDPVNGRLRYANAGQTAPFVVTEGKVEPLEASGWPLGMLPGRSYDEGEIVLGLGHALVLYSDGLSESSSESGEFFGTDRIKTVLSTLGTSDPVAALEAARRDHDDSGEEQDDDITMVALIHQKPAPSDDMPVDQVASFALPSTEDIGPKAANRVLAAVANLEMTTARRDRLYTAVAEAAMNAAEHGNGFRPDRTVLLNVEANENQLTVTVSDSGIGGPIGDVPDPNLDAKLAGLQSPRGWGLFLIRRLVDKCSYQSSPEGNRVELTVLLGSDHPDRELNPLED
jgi:serine phosphatase RsbU (regulator of sigma subunit)/anti-sigma regulatory factor (Ser/Thr protein kinase)